MKTKNPQFGKWGDWKESFKIIPNTAYLQASDLDQYESYKEKISELFSEQDRDRMTFLNKLLTDEDEAARETYENIGRILYGR